MHKLAAKSWALQISCVLGETPDGLHCSPCPHDLVVRRNVLFQSQVARNFATPPDDEEVWSKRGPAVQSPDAVGLEGRYAIALYGAASKANTISNVEKDLKSVWTIE